MAAPIPPTRVTRAVSRAAAILVVVAPVLLVVVFALTSVGVDARVYLAVAIAATVLGLVAGTWAATMRPTRGLGIAVLVVLVPCAVVAGVIGAGVWR